MARFRTHLESEPEMRWIYMLGVLLAGTVYAQQPPKTMTKMVVQLQASDIAPGSFATRPKTIYRAGTRYCRVEEQPDPEHGIHELMIINEPDAWMINLDNKTAKHIVDSGPTTNCRLPIFASSLSDVPADEAKQIAGLEFGFEREFFRNNGAKPTRGPELQGQQTTAYSLQFGDISLALFTYGTPDRPLALAWTRGDKHDIFWYSGYGQVDFDPSLFARPDHVKIEQMR